MTSFVVTVWVLEEVASEWVRFELPSGRIVALKKLHKAESENPSFYKSFCNETKILAEIRHQPEANHGESVTPSNDAQIAPLHRLSFQMSILLKLAQVSDVLALLQPIRRLQDLHLNLHRFPLKTKHYLRLLGLEQEWNGRKLSLSSPPTEKTRGGSRPTTTMADKQIIPPKHDLDAKWDACLDLTVRRFVYSSSAGAFADESTTFFCLLFFVVVMSFATCFGSCHELAIATGSPVTRWASIAFGAGVGIGSAYAECSRLFDGPPTKLPLHNASETASLSFRQKVTCLELCYLTHY
ncbi:unnamed protein product [Sphenostylis stenocarpa]|uniref:Uncharacterized protein n=1 Tax=Sphenostylis stenocarpa TaxID=92480 RepID=A0AA86TAI1_9FABA|nr:unnamed protein product [Sphenostylis stenocarpa]